MGLDKLIEKLKSRLAKDEKNSKEVNFNNIDELLDKIKKKKRKLKAQLAEEEDRHERKHLKLEMKIAPLEHRKGLKRRLKMEKNLNNK